MSTYGPTCENAATTLIIKYPFGQLNLALELNVDQHQDQDQDGKPCDARLSAMNSQTIEEVSKPQLTKHIECFSSTVDRLGFLQQIHSHCFAPTFLSALSARRTSDEAIRETRRDIILLVNTADCVAHIAATTESQAKCTDRQYFELRTVAKALSQRFLLGAYAAICYPRFSLQNTSLRLKRTCV